MKQPAKERPRQRRSPEEGDPGSEIPFEHGRCRGSRISRDDDWARERKDRLEEERERRRRDEERERERRLRREPEPWDADRRTDSAPRPRR